MPQLPAADEIADQVRTALAEDIGTGDLTAALIPAGQQGGATVVCRQRATLCGTAWFEQSFHQIDPTVSIVWSAQDGDQLQADQTLCRLSGPSRALLSGERTALNFLQTLSGTATAAATYAQAVAGTGARILDTRKTLPGLRNAQKYAVACGGAHNHRIGLYDAILIKENHILAAGSIAAALQQAQALANGVWVEVEVEGLAELQEALAAGAQRILLDNFSNDQLREAVALNQGRARLEASGGVSLETVRSIAETGVDDISVGAITKDLQAVDFSMRFASSRH